MAYFNINMESHLLAIASEKTMTPIKKSLQFGWEEFLKDPWMYILYTAIGAVANLVIYKIPVIGPFILVVLGLPLQLGIAIYYYQKNNFQDDHFKHFFDGFSHTRELLKFFLIIIGFTLLLMIPLFIIVVITEVSIDIASGGATSSQLSWVTNMVILLYTPFILFATICIILAPYFIYFFKLKAMDSIKMSYRFVKPRWWSYFRFYIVIFLIGILGALTIIGMLITTPIISLAMMHQFFTVTKMKVRKEDGSEAVLDGLVEVGA